MTEFLNEIPSNIKSKVVDKDWSKTFKFEEMPCSHGPEAKAYERVNCEKCNFDIAELDIEQKLTNQDPQEVVQDKLPDGTPITRTLSKIIIKRGKFDDAIGIEKHFS